LFVQVVRLAKEMGLVKLGTIAIDAEDAGIVGCWRQAAKRCRSDHRKSEKAAPKGRL